MPYFELYRDVDAFDKLLLVIGSLGSAGNGIIMPLFTIVLGASGGETLGLHPKSTCGAFVRRQSLPMMPRCPK